MAEITITNQNFQTEVLQSPVPVLLDFWAAWCGPCKMLAPVVAEIAEEYDGIVKVGKINVDEEPFLSAEFGVASIPTLVVIKNGKVESSSVGYRAKCDVEKMLSL